MINLTESEKEIVKKEDYIRLCKAYCKTYDTTYHVEFMYSMYDVMEKPNNKREVCKNCCYCDAEFLTGCNYPYMTN